MEKFRIKLQHETVELIRKEMESIPEKYHKQFNSMHEGLGVLREEYVELENEIFFGEKKHEVDAFNRGLKGDSLKDSARAHYLLEVKKEATQVTAMAIRIIQELT